MTFSEVYTKYLNSLEQIHQKHDEITDTDVRERLHEVINWYFIWGKPLDANFPRRYSMFSAEGDNLVATATQKFIEEALQVASPIVVGAERHALIEDWSIVVNDGVTFDYFLGSSEDVLPAEKPTDDGIYGDYDD